MNKYYEYWQKTLGQHARDKYFQEVLSYFNNKPINILELGCARRLEMDESNNPAKKMDGWSSLFWAEFIKNNGGSLTIIDTELEALANCKTLLSDFTNEINVNFILDDGLNHINNSYDLVFLDGSDSIIECLKQFEKIDRNKTSVSLDDAHLKGILVRAKYKENRIDWDVNNEGHLMSFYPSLELQNKLNINQNINNNIINEEFDKNIINEVGETGRILVIEKNGEKIAIFCPYGNNRDKEVVNWHKKVHQFYRVPVNYLLAPFPSISHGQVIDHFIRQTAQIVDYWIFLDDDLIYLRNNFVDIIYDKIKDKETLWGLSGQSNHLKGPNGEFSHPYAYGSGMGLSKELYSKLGYPSFDTDNKYSDTAEQLTYACERLGYNICLVWPSNVLGVTEEECIKHEIPLEHKKVPLGQFCFGFGTTYGQNLAFHTMSAPLERHKPMFINKCKEVLNSQ